MINRIDKRHDGYGYRIQIMQINGSLDSGLGTEFIVVDNISKGGFRFTASINFELEDRLQVQLKFPDETVKNVSGRICYSQFVDSNNNTDLKAYGFSVLTGFYDLPA